MTIIARPPRDVYKPSEWKAHIASLTRAKEEAAIAKARAKAEAAKLAAATRSAKKRNTEYLYKRETAETRRDSAIDKKFYKAINNYLKKNSKVVSGNTGNRVRRR